MTSRPDSAWRMTAGPEHAGLRLDSFLTRAIGTVSRSRVKSLITQGHATLAGVVVADPARAVALGERYELAPPPPLPALPQPQAAEFPILFEDGDVLVLDKPPGLVVHPAPGNPDHTLVNALLAHCGDTLPGIGGERRPGIVHRLDKDTSGVMVVAKTDLAMASLSAAFAARDLERSYLALCWGLPAARQGSMSGPIGRDPKDRKRMAVVARGGKEALTSYSVKRAWGTAAALLQCRLASGRTHQIRVHMATAGHPIVGDPVYLRRVPAVAKLLPSTVRAGLLDFPRQALHASVLGFRHPRTGAALRFETSLPADFGRLITLLDEPVGTALVASRLTGPG